MTKRCYLKKKNINILGNFLKQKRIKAKLSQGEVAKRLGYSSPQFISNWERNLSLPPMSILKKLSKMYNIGEEELYNMIVDDAVNTLKTDLKKKFFG